MSKCFGFSIFMPDTKISVIYEDEFVLVLNKPPGLMVHPDGHSHEQTLSDWIYEHYPIARSVGEPLQLSSGEKIERHGIVHRLDRETSGVIAVAKTQEMFLSLKEQFQHRSVRKVYNAFLYGVLKERTGSVNAPIGKSRSDFRKYSAERGAGGVLREALTEYTLLTQGSEAAFVEVRPKTGRTHQIRVHFKALGHPVICDKLYAPRRLCILGFTRLALHARMLVFTHRDGATIAAEAPLPPDFEHALLEINREPVVT